MNKTIIKNFRISVIPVIQKLLRMGDTEGGEQSAQRFGKELGEILDLAEQSLDSQWIPIKTVPLTEEEKQKAIEKYDIDHDDLEYPFAWHFDCELPEPKEGEKSIDVLVTTDLGFVKVTNFFIDYFGYPCFEDMSEAGEFVAWMPLPERYEAEVQDASSQS